MTRQAVAGAYGHWVLQYRKTWRGSAIGSFVMPLLQLAVFGFGLGAFIHDAPDGVDYARFAAPGLLAAAAVQTAAAVATHPVSSALRWNKIYQSMIAAPLGPTEILTGHLVFMAMRIAFTATAFTVWLAVFGCLTTPWALLAPLAAVLCGLACAAPIAAYSCRLRHQLGIPLLMRFVITPMFLFAGVVYPISYLPAALRPLIRLTPLWNGVELCRGLVLHTLTAGSAAVHIAALSAWLVGGFLLARAVYHRRLMS
ncbi:MAG TPA: ABC transporter permease [Actinospica sp.]|nr:ABC transporter permease [Actinospica sp.]